VGIEVIFGDVAPHHVRARALAFGVHAARQIMGDDQARMILLESLLLLLLLLLLLQLLWLLRRLQESSGKLGHL
jgi:flagellar biogenesis protein FliO